MEYKGFVAVLELDTDNGVFHGSVVNTRDVITFEGKNVKDLQKEFEASVEFYLEVCAKNGREPEKPSLMRENPTAFSAVRFVLQI